MTQTALARPNSTPGTIARSALTQDQIDLIKRQILTPGKRQVTDDELALFIGQCERTGLDPFARQIYGIYRYDKKAGGEKLTIQVSIDGARLVAERSGKYLGQDGPFWCGDDGEWSDIWLRSERPAAAKVIVRKIVGGMVAETPAVAHLSEYMPTFQDGNPSGLWGTKPALMIAKCAEMLALRKAFPQELSGLYTAEEMAQADHHPAPVVQPHPVDPAPAQLPAPQPDPFTGETHDPFTGEVVGPEDTVERITEDNAADTEALARDWMTEHQREAKDVKMILTAVGVTGEYHRVSQGIRLMTPAQNQEFIKRLGQG